MIDWKGRGMEGYNIGPRKTRAKDPHMLNYAAQYHLASASQLRGHECSHGQWLSCDPCATWLLGILSVHQVSRPMSFIYWLIFLSLVPLPFSDSLIAFPLQDLLVPCPFSSVQFSVSCSFGFFSSFFSCLIPLSLVHRPIPLFVSLFQVPLSLLHFPSSVSLMPFPFFNSLGPLFPCQVRKVFRKIIRPNRRVMQPPSSLWRSLALTAAIKLKIVNYNRALPICCPFFGFQSVGLLQLIPHWHHLWSNVPA